MKQVNLEVQPRSDTGKGAARTLRRSGIIPGVLYGQKKDTLPIQIEQGELKNLLKIEGVEASLINLELSGQEKETVMIKEIQRDPISKEVLHTDLIRISLDEEVTTSIPIVTVGTPAGVSEGGVEEFTRRELDIRCLPTEIPENIEVDVSALGIGDTILVSDLNIPDGIEVIDAPETAVFGIRPPTIITEEEIAAEEEITEPEVIGEETEEEVEGEEGEKGEERREEDIEKSED